MVTNLQKVAYRWQHPEESYNEYLQTHTEINRRRYLEKLLGRLDDADVFRICLGRSYCITTMMRSIRMINLFYYCVMLCMYWNRIHRRLPI